MKDISIPKIRSVIKLNQNLKRAKAIEQKNKQKLLAVNPNLNERSGIYFLLRTDENGFKYAYIGQARTSILQRLASHLSGYEQHIDLSLKSHKLYSEDNPHGWRIEFLNFPPNELDEKEKFYIKKYADAGYQLRNVSVGGQGSNRDSGQVGERKPPKGYRQGVLQGRKNLARELSGIIDKHLTVSVKQEKQGNKVSEKMFQKFWDLLKGSEE